MLQQPQGQSNQKRILTYVFWGALIIAAGFAVWYFFFRDTTQCDPYRAGFDTDGNPTDKCKAEKASTANTGTPPKNSGTGFQWKDEEFPLEKGMIGLKIKALQQVLGIDADSKFWTQTEGAVMKVLNGKKTVSVTDYEKLVPKTPATPSNPSNPKPPVNLVGANVYANQPAVPVFDSPNDYVPYRVAGASELLGKYIGSKKSWWGVPYAEIEWEGGKKYAETKYITFKD